VNRTLPDTISLLPVLANVVLARARDGAPAQRVARVQARLLRELVRRAYAAVPHYRDHLDPDVVHSLASAADLRHLPVLGRDDVHAMSPRDLLADGFTPANTRAASTSGSTGRPVTLYYRARPATFALTFLGICSRADWRPLDRIGYFRVGGFRRHRLERLGLARNIHVNTSLGIDEQVEIFLAGRPSVLIGFPSAMIALVTELRRRGIRPQWVRTVIFGGESLTAAARAEVLDYLSATAHEVYACVETYTIARTCPRGALHLRSADAVVEVAHDDGTVSVADGRTTTGR
jgi:phenylacetate-CoA ligase